ncbi:solute carrier family 35 member G1 isoform X3 [Manis pentadactyla]|uniref:solute carrier family 35 member G1 isoform X3 n=1 Tax=Manis pentadactyla TaxID=143292 RepID=UPI00255C9953|nr:solute carrier family 35 member G1 isoform X3 [Manis pentadactyla]
MRPPSRWPEEPGGRAAAAGARRRGGHAESAGCAMRPLDGTGEAEPPESGLSLTDHAPPDASEEPAAAEAEETPGPCRGWLCCSSPCAQPAANAK